MNSSAAPRHPTAAQAGAWAIGQLHDVLCHQTPRVGLWLDSSGQTPVQTTDEILSRAWAEAKVP
jgi:hypothetical protein